MNPNFQGAWKLLRGESEFGFLPPPRYRLDVITHHDPDICIRTHQIDSNGDQTVERHLTIGGAPSEILILNRPRLISARWHLASPTQENELIVETRSVVSGKERLLEDRWALGASAVTVTRVHHLPGGAVRQLLRFRPEAYNGH